MTKPSRPATPDQVRLLIGLSSLMVLPLLAAVMIYFTVHQTTPDHGPAWRAFVFALVVGAIMGGALVSCWKAGSPGGTPDDRVSRGR